MDSLGRVDARSIRSCISVVGEGFDEVESMTLVIPIRYRHIDQALLDALPRLAGDLVVVDIFSDLVDPIRSSDHRFEGGILV